MRAWLQVGDDGEPRSVRAIALDLHEAESTLRGRLERAVLKLQQLRNGGS
jgi:hypothetical protein